MNDGPGMTVIVRVVTRWLLGFVFVYGLGVALYGHLTPGGGFVGGVVVACALVLSILAFGKEQGPGAAFAKLASTLDAAGAIMFLGIAIFGYLAGCWFDNWIGVGKPFTLGSTWFVVLMNVAILIKVGAGAFAGFLAIVAFGHILDAEEGRS
jgi:multicomponent Na+:H+ antiporter subunit B